MITYIEFHKKISSTCVSQYVYTSTTVESLFKFAIKGKFFGYVASSSFQNCKYIFSIFLINSGIVLMLSWDLLCPHYHMLFLGEMTLFQRCMITSSFDIINGCSTIVFSSLLQRYE